MYVARILYPVKVLGPGNRIGIWMDGCKHGCKGCSNPELWEFQEKYKVSVSTVHLLIQTIMNENNVDGFTITGGDPFEQPEELYDLLKLLHTYNREVLVYTGYEFLEIERQYKKILSLIDVLIDGKYIEERNTNSTLRGSDNQKIYYLNEGIESKYNSYLCEKKNEIQNFTSSDGIISVGIHKTNYQIELEKAVIQKGLEEL